jgi:hypothetical protein
MVTDETQADRDALHEQLQLLKAGAHRKLLDPPMAARVATAPAPYVGVGAVGPKTFEDKTFVDARDWQQLNCC